MKEINILIKEQDFLTSSTKIDDAIEKIGYPCIVSVKKQESSISDKQRKYYFGVVVPIIMDYTGDTKIGVHNMLKCLFLLDYEDLLDKMIQSTDRKDARLQMAKFMAINKDLTITNEDTGSFERYLKEIRMFYNELRIPLPNESQRWEGYELMF